MDKKNIIEMVSNMKQDIGETNINRIFSDVKSDNNNSIGTSQFVEIANLCNSAECYEEIELLIQYNIAKAKGKSWAFPCNNNKTFGSIVIKCMEKVHKDNNDDDINTLKDLSLYFGYLFWQAKVWIMQAPKVDNTKLNKR